MTDLFQTVLNMSITGAYIAAAIILLRLAMKKLPKKYSYALWLILGIRLLCPVSFSSAVSLFNIVKPETSDNRMTYISENYDYSQPTEAPPIISDTQIADEAISAVPDADTDKGKNVNMKTIIPVCSWIWFAGVLAMAGYSVVTYALVHKKVSRSEHLQDNVYVCKNISSPFVYGIIKPRIYLPSNVPGDELDYILAHEKAHISRGDHIVKIIALAALSVHWFNPLVWLSYKLMVWDMELSCDDIALRSFERDVRKEYANTLLKMSLRQNKISLGGILAFGETNIKSRVKSVLSSKKPKVIAIALAVVIVITAAVCLLTNAVGNNKKPVPDDIYVTEKLLYLSPLKSTFRGDDNGIRYEIKGGTLTLSDGYPTNIEEYTLSAPMEIPFAESEWDEAFGIADGTGWRDGIKKLSDYKPKYCIELYSDKDGGVENYLLVMDEEIWFVQWGWEIYRLKKLEAGELQETVTEVSEETIPEINETTDSEDGLNDSVASADMLQQLIDSVELPQINISDNSTADEIMQAGITAANFYSEPTKKYFGYGVGYNWKLRQNEEDFLPMEEMT